MEFVLLAGLRSFAQLFSLLFSLYDDICSKFPSALWPRHLQTSAVPADSRCSFIFTSQNKRSSATPGCSFNSASFFSRICECLVPYFDSTSSEPRNVFFFSLVHGCILVTHFTSPGWCLVSLVLPELCIVMMTLSLLRFYLERPCCVFLSWYVFPLGLVLNILGLKDR